MVSELIRERLKAVPSRPGCYLMRDRRGVIIYIGKAKNLRNRVTSYFRENPDHTPKVAAMVSHVYDYDFIVTDSEYEALSAHNQREQHKCSGTLSRTLHERLCNERGSERG